MPPNYGLPPGATLPPGSSGSALARRAAAADRAPELGLQTLPPPLRLVHLPGQAGARLQVDLGGAASSTPSGATCTSTPSTRRMEGVAAREQLPHAPRQWQVLLRLLSPREPPEDTASATGRRSSAPASRPTSPGRRRPSEHTTRRSTWSSTPCRRRSSPATRSAGPSRGCKPVRSRRGRRRRASRGDAPLRGRRQRRHGRPRRRAARRDRRLALSIALEPPLVSISIAHQAAVHELPRAAGGYAASMLAADQVALAQHFSRRPADRDVGGVDANEGPRGPLIAGAVGWPRVRARRRARGRRPARSSSAASSAPSRLRRAAAPPPRRRLPLAMIEAVALDLDGVIVDSSRSGTTCEQLAKERGGRWHEGAQAAMMGMSSREWSAYMHDEIGLADSPQEINDEVVRRLLARYRESLPLIGTAPSRPSVGSQRSSRSRSHRPRTGRSSRPCSRARDRRAL